MTSMDPALASVTTRAPSRAAQYARMSTEHQQYSPENQLEVVCQYAAAHNMEIVQEYSGLMPAVSHFCLSNSEFEVEQRTRSLTVPSLLGRNGQITTIHITFPRTLRLWCLPLLARWLQCGEFQRAPKDAHLLPEMRTGIEDYN